MSTAIYLIHKNYLKVFVDKVINDINNIEITLVIYKTKAFKLKKDVPWITVLEFKKINNQFITNISDKNMTIIKFLSDNNIINTNGNTAIVETNILLKLLD